MNKIFVDSSVVISSFGRADEYTSQSNQFFEKVRKGYDLVISDLVLIEVAVRLSQQKIPGVDQLIDSFMEAQTVALDEGFVRKCLPYLDLAEGLRSSDFSLAVAAKLSRATLVTWDKRLLDNKICEVMTPSDFLKSKRK